jgi:hypothetical protein
MLLRIWIIWRRKKLEILLCINDNQYNKFSKQWLEIAMETPKQKCRISKTGVKKQECLHVQILIFIYLKIVLLYIAPWGKRINIVWLKWFKSSIFKKILALSYQNEKISTRKYFLSKLNIIKKKYLYFLYFKLSPCYFF